MLPIFPTHRFNPQIVKADVVPMMIDGGTAINGDQTAIQTDGGGRWEITYSGIALSTPALIRLCDAWTAYMPGRRFFVPLVSLYTAPRPANGSAPARPSQLFSNDPDFPTEVRYAVPYIVASVVTPPGAIPTQMAVNVSQGARLQAGMKGMVAGRAFKIERIIARVGQQATFSFVPPIRDPISAGEAVTFDWPMAICKLALGQDLSPPLSFGRSAEMAVSFIEDRSVSLAEAA